MKDDDPTDPVTGNSRKDSTDIPKPQNNPTRTNAQDETDNRQDREIESLERDIKKGERWIILLTGAMAFFSLCSVIVSLLQWNTYKGQLIVMQGQLNEMRGSSAQTDKLIAEMRKLADSAKESVAENREGLHATLAQGQKAMDASIDSSRNDQRALVGPKAGTYKVTIGPHGGITQEYDIANFGKTAALNVQAAVGVHVVTKEMVPIEDFACPPKEDRTVSKPSVMFPGGVRVVRADPEDLILNQQTFAQLKTGEVVVILNGCIWYNDIFSKTEHRTRFCLVTNGTIQGAQTCGVNNDAY